MPGKHKDSTVSFRPNAWERAIIEQRAAVSGMNKKDFIAQSCIHSRIVIEDSREAVLRIVDAMHDMQITLLEIAGQVSSGNFPLSAESYLEMKQDYAAFLLTVVDILDDAAYLFEKEPPSKRRNWKAEMELEQLRDTLQHWQDKEACRK